MALARSLWRRWMERDAFWLNRHRANLFCLSMISSENRDPLFRIMLQADPLHELVRCDWNDTALSKSRKSPKQTCNCKMFGLLARSFVRPWVRAR